MRGQNGHSRSLVYTVEYNDSLHIYNFQNRSFFLIVSLMSGTSKNRLIVVGEERQSSGAQVVIFKSVWLRFVVGGINCNIFFFFFSYTGT